MDRFPFVPRGKVTVTYDWQSKSKEFEDKTIQYIRRRIHAAKSYSFTIQGKNYQRLVDFYNNHRGQLDPFYFVYDDAVEVCRFSNSLNPTLHRENGKTLGFSCDIGLTVEKITKKFPKPLETDLLPPLRNAVSQSYDWETGVVTYGAKSDYRLTRTKPKVTISGKWSGGKRDRDKIIKIFNSHSRKPASIKYEGKTLKVIMPDKLAVNDFREVGDIVGFECDVDLEVVT